MVEIDPFAFEEEDDGDKKITDVVKERNRLGKRSRELEKERDEYKADALQFRALQKESALAKVFIEAGVNPKQAKWFTRENPEADVATVTKEQVIAFAQENDFAVVAPAPEGEAGDEKDAGEKKEGFNPIPTPPSGGASVGVTSRADWLKLAGQGPEGAEQARQLLHAGKVDLSEVYAGLGPRV